MLRAFIFALVAFVAWWCWSSAASAEATPSGGESAPSMTDTVVGAAYGDGIAVPLGAALLVVGVGRTVLVRRRLAS